MWTAAMRDRWDHTAAIQAQIYNANRGKGSPVRKAESFNPIRQLEKAAGMREEVDQLQLERAADPLA